MGLLGAALFLPLSCSSSTENGGGTTDPVPPTPVDPAGPRDPDITAKAAVFMGSCIWDDGIQRSLTRLYERAFGIGEPEQSFYNRTHCFEDKANGCQAAADCLGVTVDRAGPCASSCQGSLYEACDDSTHWLIQCSRVGLTCDEEGCGRPLTGAACDVMSYQDVCQDGAPNICGNRGQVLAGAVCTDFGLECGPSPDWTGGDSVGCRGTGADCDTSSFSPVSISWEEGLSCDDSTTLRLCVSGGEHLLDCSTVGQGFSCQTTSTAAFCGLGSECDPQGMDTSCDGNSVVVCNAGREDRIDCTALGFSGCDAQHGVCIPGFYSP